jgi:hypothetical protein
MRLAFLCSGLEPGRDGVGDFTRTLAAACSAAGHETRLAAIRDPFLSETTQPPKSLSVAEPRLRDIFQHPDESRALTGWLRDFEPDWVSVQFTPFGFHPRGLGASRAAHLRSLLPPKSRRHIMFHEIWLQPGIDGLWRHRALGWWQRRSVDAWTGFGWQPQVVQTQARLHQARLQLRGVTVSLLPLCTPFSNPLITQPEARASISAALRATAASSRPLDESALWIGHFGTLHLDGWNFPAYASQMVALAAASGKRICFLALGRARAASAAWAEAGRLVPQADFRVLGELPPEKVPLTMQACDAAITSTPWDIIEKSSAVAAWRAVGVPVLVTRAGTTHSKNLPPWPDPGLILADASAPVLPKPFERISAPAYLAPAHAAQTFLQALSASSQSSPA